MWKGWPLEPCTWETPEHLSPELFRSVFTLSYEIVLKSVDTFAKKPREIEELFNCTTKVILLIAQN